MSFDRLIQQSDEKKAPVVVGLDPTLSQIPEFIRQDAFQRLGETLEAAADAIFSFNKELIDALWDIVPAVKPQCAYYEQFGWQGVRALEQTIAYAQEKGLFVITDGKRNDIGSTMEAYANAHLGTAVIGNTQIAPFHADALTVNGYLGTDGIKPLLNVCAERDCGIFVLCKTSNPSSGELQDRLIDGEPVYAQMGMLCENWGAAYHGAYGYSCVGAVVGATYPQQLQELREKLPHTLFLVPGYGAQGGKAEDIALGFDKNGRGAIVNSSRAIACAYQKEGWKQEDFGKAAREETQRMIRELQAAIR